jgi:hypothetical protein
MATAVSYIAFLMRHKTQWCGVVCSERVTRQAPYVVPCVVRVRQDRHLNCNLSFGRIRPNIVEEEKKQLLLILGLRILDLVIRHAMRMRRVILLLSIIFLHIARLSEKKNVENKICVLVHLKFLSESFLVLTTIHRSVIIALNSPLCYHCTQLVFTLSTGSSLIFE